MQGPLQGEKTRHERGDKMTRQLAELGREFWRAYLDTDDQVTRLLREAAFNDLLERVYDEGYDEGRAA